MKKSLSFTDIVLYLISVFVILGVSMYLSVFFQTENQVFFDMTSYSLFLNTIYKNRLYYCLYKETKDPYILFYLPEKIEKINSYSSLLEKCYTVVGTSISELVENKSEKDTIILKYNTRNIAEIPIFVFLDLKNNEKIWIYSHAKKLFKDEKKRDLWSNIVNFVFPVMRLIDAVRKFIQKIEFESNPENFLSCSSDRAYYISAVFTLPFLSIDTKRDLYTINIYKFIKIKGKECKKIIISQTVDQQGRRQTSYKSESC